jgi:D-alanine-D-alanine ligase
LRIGLCYDLKEAVHLEGIHPEDALEEYDSPATVEAIAAAIEAQGHSVVKLGGGEEFLANIIRQEKFDLVFNIAEGLGNYRSREAQVPAILEMLNIPCSGSDPQCLAISLDKPLTKKILSASGILTPRWQVASRKEQLSEIDWDGFPFPAFVKPAYEGSSKGIGLASRVDTPEQAEELVAALLERYQQPAMVEEFISGDDITVGVVGNSSPEVVGIMRVLPRDKRDCFIYSLEVKRDWERLVDYECPARLEKTTFDKIADASLKVFEVLGCRDFSRVDFKLGSDGVPYFLEINPLPGLNPKSGDLPIMAGRMGWTYRGLISAILNAALERYPIECCLK